MLKGTGTEESPLHARFIEFMDMNLMNHVEREEKGIVLIIRDIETDDLFAFGFTLENFKEMIEKSGELINDCI
jgi:hypothetical protein